MNLPRPRHISVAHHGDTLQVRWRWLTPHGLGMSLVAFTWLAAAIFFRVFTDVPQGGWALVSTIMVVSGVFFAYGALTDLVNTTTITVSPAALAVRHGPLPAARSCELPRSTIRQLYCVERDEGMDAPKPRFDLYAQRHDGSRVALLSGLTRAEYALFLEQTIEAALNLPDELVDGELKAAWRQSTPALVVE